MLNYVITDDAKKDLDAMDNTSYQNFYKTFKKIICIPGRKHMKHGLAFFKERVGDGRITYQIKGDTVYIMRCFTNHQSYERWYKTQQK